MERAKHLAVQAVLTAGILAVYALGLTGNRDRIVEGLKSWTPLGLAAAFAACVVLSVLAWPDIRGLFAKRLTRRQWRAAAVVPAAAFLLAFGYAPRTHRIYYDENIYLHIGQSIAETGKAQMVNFGDMRDGELIVNQAEYNKQPNAYPFLLSLIYRVAGTGDEFLSFLFTNVTFAVGAFLVFLLGLLLFDEFKIGLYAAAAYIVIPQNILWHNTTAVEPANTAAIVLTLFLTFAFLRAPKLPLFFLVIATAAFTSQFRMETLLVFALIFVYLLIDRRDVFREAKAYYAVPLALALILPHILHLFSFQGHPWGSSSPEKFGLAFFGHNLATNGLFFLNNLEFPALLTVAALAAFLFRRKSAEKMQAGVWFLAFWGVFLFFYAGSYHYGADVRFSLMAFPPLALLAGAGLADIDGWAARSLKRPGTALAGVLILAASFLMFAPEARSVGQEAWAARADHRYAREMLDFVPKDAIVFTHNPNMFLFWGRSSAQASILAGYDAEAMKGLRASFPGGVYFHFNFWCSVSDPVQQSFCQAILDKFPHAEVARYRERDYSYVLYKIE
jgi:hypothetical protein